MMLRSPVDNGVAVDGELVETVVFKQDNSLEIARLLCKATGETISYTVPPAFKKRGLELLHFPIGSEERANFFKWRNSLYAEIAHEIWSVVSSLKILRYDRYYLRIMILTPDVVGIDGFFHRVREIGEEGGRLVSEGIIRLES